MARDIHSVTFHDLQLLLRLNNITYHLLRYHPPTLSPVLRLDMHLTDVLQQPGRVSDLFNMT